ncbi:bifunctional 2-polyprenyl-6-hydroxyphenol methylase/3-demethylubiquinol 3-O-methyltransferase UbiG [Allokutzneria sp. NRRL B-24872]|uniref:class I SAM-dependent methyltransferase n=1 Tax=Allokutzneria sp. NRRL B-24872 TaxID=1137961 RepID=UPI000A3C26AD|nr:class I SAM-dependent methyltransferase [Allokutzneria sp. NRRL B-24872]
MGTQHLYGDAIADVYDRLFPGTADAEHAADFVAALCPEGGKVLELGVGTGRLALPIAARGHHVHGVDASARMLEKLREKDPEQRVTTSVGDFAGDPLDERYDVVLLACHGLCGALEQQSQVRTLIRMGEQLADGGRVVLETYEPKLYQGQNGPVVAAQHLIGGGLLVSTTYANSHAQIVHVQHSVMDGSAQSQVTETNRWVWPSELDLMARIAGLELEQRWSGWLKEPYGPDATRLVSVYRKVDAP